MEMPSEIDAFEAGSHQRIADSIFDTISRDDVNVIGIEGELGSGKSTVIKLLEPGCHGRFELIHFDVEKYQHGATKKALIETIFKKLSEDLQDKPNSLKEVQEAKDTALGNRLKYDVSVTSKIDGWVLVFALSLLFAVSQLSNFLKGLAGFVGYMFSILGFMSLKPENYTVDFLAIISGLIVLVPAVIAYASFKGTKLFGKKPQATGNLLKRGGTDTVDEFFNITKEVGAFELQQALGVFSKNIQDQHQYILIIDNLDRVTNDKLREVWSDIDVFSTIAHTKIKLLIPYSHKHIAASLCANNYEEGREFISKRLPITYRVSPIISADWLAHFENMMTEAFGEIIEKSRTTSGILVSLIAGSEKRITPRYLKRVINSVVSIKLVSPDSTDLETAFFYQLTVGDDKYSIEEILDINIVERLGEDSASVRNLNIMSEAREKLFNSISFEQYSKDVVAIHYQTKYEIAESELLRNPLINALNERNIDPFLDKQGIFGYARTVQSIFEIYGWIASVSLVAQTLKHLSTQTESSKSLIKSWLDIWVIKIAETVRSNSAPVPLSVIKDVLQIVAAGYEFPLIIFEEEFSALSSMAEDYKEHEKFGRDQLEKLHVLSGLLKKNPEFIDNLDINLFKDHLWENRSYLPDWNISKFKFNFEQRFALLTSFTESIDGELAGLLMSQFVVGGFKVNKAEWVDGLPKTVLDLLTPKDLSIEDLYSFCLSSSWRNSDTLSTYIAYADDITEPDVKSVWEAQSVGLVISLGSPSSMSGLTIESELTEQFVSELANVLTIHANESLILKSLKDSRTVEYAGAALRYLIKKRRIHRLSISNVLKDFELICELTKLTELEVAQWLTGWSNYIDVEKNGLEQFDSFPDSFTKCVMESNVVDFFELYKESLESKHVTTEWWKIQLKSPLSWVSIVLNQLNKKGITLKKGKFIREAIEWTFSDNNQSIKRNAIDKDRARLLINILKRQVRSACVKHLEKTMNEYRTSSETQIEIFRVFGDLVSFKVTEDATTQEVVLTIFEYCPEYMENQDFNFSVWTNENIERFVALLKNHEEDGYVMAEIRKNNKIKRAISKYELQQNDIN